MTDNYCIHCNSYKTDAELKNYKCPCSQEYVYIKFDGENGPKATYFKLATELEQGDMIPIPYTDDFREILGIRVSGNNLFIGLKEYGQVKVVSTKRINTLEGTWSFDD